MTCDYLQREFLVSCKPLLKVLACADMILLLILSQHTGHKIWGNLMHIQIVFQNAQNQSK
jgi:hypothetical protein